MPANKNFELRIAVLDELLASTRRRTIEEVLQILNEHLEGNGGGKVSRRTLFNDLNELEAKGAPIIRPVGNQKCIYYGEKWSLKNVPIDEEDVSLLKQAITILKKATDLNIMSDLDAIIAKLENKVYTNVPDSTTMIAFEQHTKASGQEHFDDLFNAIQNKCTLKITYQPFNKEARDWIISPYMLKEYRNRWFLICKKQGNSIPTNLALDRILKISNCIEQYEDNDLFNPDTYFNDLIGVSFPEEKELQRIIIKVMPELVDYILTKPIHKSQTVLQKNADGGIDIHLQLFINFELTSHLLSYGSKIEVLEPLQLREKLKAIFQEGEELYCKK